MTENEAIDISYHQYQEVDLSKSIIIVGFRTTGLVGTIAANYIIKNRELNRVGAFLSDSFEPMAKIKDGRPSPPITVYSGDNIEAPEDINRVTIITSDIPVDKSVLPHLADKIIEFAKENDACLITTLEGFQTSKKIGHDDSKVLHISNRESTDRYANNLPTEVLENGMLGGMSGLLQYKGDLANYPVLTLLEDAHKQFPDSRSAAKLIEILNILIPGIEMDPEPLIEEAEKIEQEIQNSMNQLQQQKNRQGTKESMPYVYA